MEREKLKEMEKMGRRLEKLKVERKNYRVGDKGEEDIRVGVEERRSLREIEKKVETKEREEKRKNIMMRGLEDKGRWKEEEVEKLPEEIGRK